MDYEDKSVNNDHQNDERENGRPTETKVMEGDTYPISDDESATDVTSLIDAHANDNESNRTMSQDSLIDDEEHNEEKLQTTTSVILTQSNGNSKLKSSSNGARSINLDEHIKLVQQKKEEVEELRLQKFQEQLRKKEQKWQQQQVEKVKKWLQLRNRDTDHRSQVEERRKKREEETKVKIEELLRREKEREQKANSHIKVNLRGNATHRPDSIMSMSVDIHSTRRAISAPRLRTTPRDMTNRRGLNDSPVTTVSQDNGDNSTTANTSHQLDPIDEHQRRHRSRHSYDATMPNEDSSLSGTPRTLASSRTRPMPTAYTYWLNTGDNNNHINANFMRLTYAATCRSRLSRSVERCPRACRARDDTSTNPTTTTTNSESQRRVQSINRQHLNETIERLAKPKTIPITQTVRSGATTPTTGIASSQSTHQFRVSTPPANSNNHLTPTSTPSKSRRNIQPRPVNNLSINSPTSSDSRASPTADGTPDNSSIPSSSRQSSHRSNTNHPKLPLPPSSKPPIASRSKPPTPRSQMTTSFSSSSVSTTTTPTKLNKQNVRRIGGLPISKEKPKTETIPSVEIIESQPSSKDAEEENPPVDESSQEKDPEENIDVNQLTTSLIEPINIDAVTEIINPTATTKRNEQQTLDEQEYQRKLNQKKREVQQRLELERQREEERKRQLELEELAHEQEQIRLAEEQRLAEEERLRRAIEERDRENELKRQEEQRLQQQREELERKQAEETERINRERQERIKREEEERNERKRRLDLIMRRTRQVSPSLKQENNNTNNNISTTNNDETNGHDQNQSSITHSKSDNRFPTSSSNENILNTTNESTTPETSKFKSPLIQNLLNKARNTKSTDNLTQSSMTTSQIMNESMIDEGTTTIQSTTQSDSSDGVDDDDDDQPDSGINNATNGHDSPLSSSTNLNSSSDRPVETTATF